MKKILLLILIAGFNIWSYSETYISQTEYMSVKANGCKWSKYVYYSVPISIDLDVGEMAFLNENGTSYHIVEMSSDTIRNQIIDTYLAVDDIGNDCYVIMYENIGRKRSINNLLIKIVYKNASVKFKIRNAWILQ